ncbi:MAG: tetratricopeptide repeat protein [Candidatus Heimdallarchaeota archaeon]|nr:tetratricopeptide repeat protein [Candidatus Heimdallarchaeota archaeon]
MLELIEIEKLIQYGKFIESSNWFKKNRLSEELNKKEKNLYKILYCHTLIGLKEAESTLPIIDEIIEETTKEKLEKYFFEAIIIKGLALETCQKYKESLEIAEQGLEFLENIPIKEQKEYQLQKAKMLKQKGTSYYQLDDAEKTLYYSKQALKEFEKLNNTNGIAFMLSIIGIAEGKKRNYTKAIEFLNESLALFIEMKNDYNSAIIYHYLGRIYTSKGELNQAYDYMMKSLPIILSFDDDYRIAVTMLHLIPIQIERGEYERAKEFSIQCLKLIERLGYIQIVGILYYRMIRIALYQEDLAEAKKNLGILYSLREKYSNPNYYEDYYQLANALIIKNSDHITDLTIAEEIFRNIINGDIKNSEIIFEAMYNLSELLLQEFQNTNNLEILEEVDILSKKILEYGKRAELAGLRIKSYNIRLLLLFVLEQFKEGSIDFQEVDSLFKETQKLAEKLGLKATIKQFSKQYSNLMNQKYVWDDFIKEYYSQNI